MSRRKLTPDDTRILAQVFKDHGPEWTYKAIGIWYTDEITTDELHKVKRWTNKRLAALRFLRGITRDYTFNAIYDAANEIAPGWQPWRDSSPARHSSTILPDGTPKPIKDTIPLNKSTLIRQTITSNPTATPKEIVAKLQAKGHMVTMGLVYQVMHAAKKRNQNRKARMSKPKIDWKKTKFWRVTKIANPTSPRNPWLLQYEGPNAQGSLTFQSQDFRTKKEAQHFAQKAVDLGKAMP